MADTPIPLRIDLELANVDRGVTEQLVIQTARHPSEKMERVWLRVLAYAWQWRPGMTFGGSVSDPDEPDLASVDDTGRTTAVVFVGKPEPRRVLKVRSRSSEAEAAILFETPDRMTSFVLTCESEGLTARIADIERAAVERDLLEQLARWDERRMKVSMTLSGDTWYVEQDGDQVSGPLVR
jgi:uncharacterized protein YaeQ